MTNGSVWLNGALLPRPQAKVDAFSQGFLHGAGIYDSLLLRNGRPVAFDRHFRRLESGVARLQLPPPDGAALRNGITTLAGVHGLRDARVRITIAAGPSASVLPGPAEGHITMIGIAPLKPLKETAALTLTPYRRNEHGPLAGVKFTACPDNLIAQCAAISAGFDEALFRNTAGDICEAAFANIFAVASGQVLTPPLNSGCLAGVTREIVLELCAARGVPAREAALTAAMLYHADELFVTSSIRGIQPVHRLDACRFPAPGPVTRQLTEHYAAWQEAEASSGLESA